MSKHNIRKAIKSASAGQRNQGMIWYRDYSKLLSGIGETFGASPEATIGAFSALSPRVTVNQNIIGLTRLLMAWKDNEDIERKVIPGTNTNKMKAWNILNNAQDMDLFEVLGGLKTANFYYNLISPFEVQGHGVTVDTWAYKVWIGDYKSVPHAGVKGKIYETISLHYRVVAQEFDILPCQAQAIAWLTYRDKYQIN